MKTVVMHTLYFNIHIIYCTSFTKFVNLPVLLIQGRKRTFLLLYIQKTCETEKGSVFDHENDYII